MNFLPELVLIYSAKILHDFSINYWLEITENDNREVNSVLYVQMNNNKFIAAVGWDHRLNIFADQTDYLHLVQRPLPHWPDDIVRVLLLLVKYNLVDYLKIIVLMTLIKRSIMRNSRIHCLFRPGSVETFLLK